MITGQLYIQTYSFTEILLLFLIVSQIPSCFCVINLSKTPYKVCTKDLIQTLNSKELVLESLKDSEYKQYFIRDETPGEQFDSSFVRKFM